MIIQNPSKFGEVIIMRCIRIPLIDTYIHLFTSIRHIHLRKDSCRRNGENNIKIDLRP